MTAESRIARRTGLPVACAGADAHAAALRLLDEGVSGIVSFGIAGGLAPGVRPGMLVVATAVIGEGEVFTTNQAWRTALLHALPHATSAPLAGVSAPVATVADKAALHALTGAVAVEMESLAVARACRDRGRPFAVLRAIADPAERAVPAAALAGLDAGGRMAPGAVLGPLLRDPGHIMELCRLGWDFARAMAALNAAARAFPGRSLGLDPLERVGDVA